MSSVFKQILDRDDVEVSKSPWGPDDEIGRLNWITPETDEVILEHLDEPLPEAPSRCSRITLLVSSMMGFRQPIMPPQTP